MGKQVSDVKSWRSQVKEALCTAQCHEYHELANFTNFFIAIFVLFVQFVQGVNND